MPITYVSGATGTTSLTLPATATAAGDILIASAFDSAAISDSLAGTYDGGAWTRFVAATGSFTWLSVWWSRATGDHQSQTVTKTGMINMGVTVWRGCIASGSPLDTNTSATGQVEGDVTVTGFDTTVANTMTVLIASLGGTGASWSGQTKNSVAMDERIDAGMTHCSLAQAASGATGNFFADCSNDSAYTHGAAFALKPPSAGIVFPRRARGLVMRYPRR